MLNRESERDSLPTPLLCRLWLKQVGGRRTCVTLATLLFRND